MAAVTMKSEVLPFATMPVGLNAPLAPAARLTIKGPAAGCGLPLPSYSVEVWVALFATQAGAVPGIDSPHGLMRFGSTLVAVPPAASATKFVSE